MILLRLNIFPMKAPPAENYSGRVYSTISSRHNDLISSFSLNIFNPQNRLLIYCNCTLIASLFLKRNNLRNKNNGKKCGVRVQIIFFFISIRSRYLHWLMWLVRFHFDCDQSVSLNIACWVKRLKQYKDS